MPGMRKVEARGSNSVSLLDSRFKSLPFLSLISHPVTTPNASAVTVVFQVATRDCKGEMESEESDSYSSREKRSLLFSSYLKADQKIRVTFQRNFQFL